MKINKQAASEHLNYPRFFNYRSSSAVYAINVHPMDSDMEESGFASSQKNQLINIEWVNTSLLLSVAH